jgi:hypothetical protein
MRLAADARRSRLEPKDGGKQAKEPSQTATQPAACARGTSNLFRVAYIFLAAFVRS